MNFEADIDSVFFNEFAANVLVGVVHCKALIDQDLEIIDDDGTVDLVEYAVTAKQGVITKGDSFIYLNSPWKVGRLLEKASDGLYEVWEMVGA